MKYHLMMALLSAAFLAAAAELTVQPSFPVAGEPFMIVLSSSSGRPVIDRAPDVPGLQWFLNRTSSGYRNINGRATYTAGFTVLAEKPGEYRLPALRIRCGRKTETTPPVTLKVAPAETAGLEAAETGSAQPPVSGRIRLADERKKFYIGEEIPLFLELYIRPGTRVTGMTYPELVIPHAVFRDFRRENPENPRFARPEEHTRTVGGKRMVAVTMRTAFRMLAAGPVTPEATGEISIAAESRRNRPRDPFWDDDDDFFSGFFSRRESVRRKIVFTSPGPIEIQPLPPPPETADFTGLLGRWEMQFSLDRPEDCKVGSLMTLKLRLSGSGSAELLKLPKLALPGFRVYPAEIRKTPGAVEVSWQIIPLKTGKTPLHLALATFDPADGQYHESRFDRVLTAAPADRMPGSAVAAAPAAEKSTEAVRQNAPAPLPENRPHLLYLAKTPGKPEPMPPGAHLPAGGLLLLLGGPLLWGLAELRLFRREKLAGSESMRRKRQACAAAGDTLKKLRNAPDDAAWDEVINTGVLPLLADRFDLPPGSTAREILPKITDAGLADALRAAGENAYLPGAAPRPAIDRKKVLKALKKLFVFALLFLALPGMAEDRFAAAGAAYDKGDFAGAWKRYQTLLKTEGPSAGLLYNAGCAAFMSDAPAAALACFDAAMRLEPRNSAAQENLNVVRAKLGQNAVGRVESPRDLVIFCRDSFRPDEWLLLACAAWFAGFTVLIFRRQLSAAALQTGLGTAGAVIVLALAAYAAQMHGPYAADRAVIADGGAAMRALPTDAGRAEGGLPAGQEVTILEERGPFALVRCGTLQGWIPQNQCRKIWQKF